MLGILAAIAFGISFLTSLGLVSSFGVFFVNWMFGTFRWLFDVATLAIIAGYVWKGDFWYFFMTAPGELAKDDNDWLLGRSLRDDLLIECRADKISRCNHKKKMRKSSLEEVSFMHGGS